MLETIKQSDSKETREKRICFITQEEYNVFDNCADIQLTDQENLSFEDTGIGGTILQTFYSNLLPKLEKNEIEYVIVQPLLNKKSKLIDLDELGYTIKNELDVFLKLYEKADNTDYPNKQLVTFTKEETLRFYSECVFHVSILFDPNINYKFNLSLAFRVLDINKHIFCTDRRRIELRKAKALKILMKDFLKLGNSIGGIVYDKDAYEEVSLQSKLNSL